MVFDLVAGARQPFVAPSAAVSPLRPPRVLVFDSGLGGLSVFPSVRAAWPGAWLLYAADDAVFPYGRLAEATLIDRVLTVIGALVSEHRPDVVVIACHTASTSVLGPLRQRWPEIGFVGTVPAIKPAASASTSGLISVLATPGTVAREYTRDLVTAYAGRCVVTLVGASRLAGLAEAAMGGEAVDEVAIRQEIAPAFVAEGDRRTDVVVLACTHYPLVLPTLRVLAPWPVTWIDPAPAIARRVARMLEESGPWVVGVDDGNLVPAVFTANQPPSAALARFLAARGVNWQASAALSDLDRAGSAG